jgi:hypothetical protein
MEIASRMLGRELEVKKRTFFNFRHTGASHIAQRAEQTPICKPALALAG